MPLEGLLQSETTIKHFTWCSRAENFVECTKRQCYQLRLSPEACCPNGFDLWPVSKTNLSSKRQWSTCSQFSSSISQGVDWKRSKLCWFYIVLWTRLKLTGNANAWQEIGYLRGDFVVKFDTYTVLLFTFVQSILSDFRLTLSASNFKLVGHCCLFEIFLTQKLDTARFNNGSSAGAKTTTEIKCS